MRSLGTRYMEDIVGARAVQAGRAPSASGVIARGYRLVIRLVQPLGDFPARTSMPFFCAVPPNLPADPEGRGEFAGSGPYYVDEYRPGQRVLDQAQPLLPRQAAAPRRRLQRRPHGGSPQDVLDRIEDGRADWGIVPPPLYFAPERALVAEVRPQQVAVLRPAGLHASRLRAQHGSPLFRGNPALRKAVNLAVDRTAFGAGMPRRALTDQFLPPNLPGFHDAKIYPLAGPNLRKARQLARGHLRGGKATLYVADQPLTLALGQMLKTAALGRSGSTSTFAGIPQPAYDDAVVDAR